MTNRSRDAARAAVLEYSAGFSAEAPLMPTVELRERMERGEDIILVDVRDVEEQRVSMIPGALSRTAFEADVLPALLQQRPRCGGTAAVADAGQDEDGGGGPLVVPYCTVGYRSGVYCRELLRTHGLRHVRNGEGVIMWTFDGGYLVRPLPGAEPSRAPPLRGAQPVAYGRSSDASGREAACVEAAAPVWEVHVYGKPWDIAAESYRTTYYSPATIVLHQTRSRCCGRSALPKALWLWALAPFYLFFTPACGVMFKCGCRMALSKWGQVETCNIYDAGAIHRCPWCTCSGFSCIFVASDAKAFRGVFLLDLMPDGCFVTVLTVLVIALSWRGIDKFGRKHGLHLPAVVVAKTSLATTWFLAYCLVVGGLFFVGRTDYPYFLGIERVVPAPPSPAAAGPRFPGLLPPASRLLLSVSELRLRRGDWVVVDARGSQPAGGVIPGAVAAPWQAFAQGGASERRSALLPPAEILERLAAVGVNRTSPVVVYGSWDQGWGEEGRLFWMLDYLGFNESRLACLDGGIEAWRAAGLQVASRPAAAAGPLAGSGGGAGAAQPVPDEGVRATTPLVQQLVAQAGRAILLDTRELREFEGLPTGDLYGAPRSGHIPGAIWWPWRERLFAPSAGSAAGPPSLRPCDEILGSLPAAAAGAEEVVAYCTGGIRSGFVYLALRGCGLGGPGRRPRVRNYDGSWWAWSANSSLGCEGLGPGCSAPAPSAPGHGGSGFGAL